MKSLGYKGLNTILLNTNILLTFYSPLATFSILLCLTPDVPVSGESLAYNELNTILLTTLQSVGHFMYRV